MHSEEISDIQHSNISEEEMGQLHGIHIHLNAIAAVRRNISTGISREYCTDCGEKIVLARRIAVAGCKRCITCQTLAEPR